MNEPLVFTLEDLRAVLEPDVGKLTGLTLTPPVDPSSSTATWSAVNMDGDVLEGGLDVHLEHQEDGTFLLKPVVTIEGASGRRLELPWRGQP
jgi:hypothetical protein